MRVPEVFREDDIKRIDEGLDSLRKALAFGGSYERGRWMVSALNRRPDVVRGDFPKTVTIRDITLRTSEQLSGVAISDPERIRFLRELVSAGVKSVQLSCFRRGHGVEQMKAEVEAIKSIDPECETQYGAATSEKDVLMAAQAGIDSIAIWTAFLGGGAPACAGAVYYRAWNGRDWRDLNFPVEPKDQIERSLRMVELGKQHGVKVGGSINLLSYADEAYMAEYAARVGEAGACEIALADGASGCAPEAVDRLVRIARAAAPNTPIAVHTHNLFGLAVANALAAARAGAQILEVAVNEYEHGASQADLATVVAALEVLYGVDTSVELERLVPLARLAEELTGHPLPERHPITGRRVFESAGSDEYVQEYKYDPVIHCALNAEVVGNKREIALSPQTGPFTMYDKLTELGIDPPDARAVEEILRLCKQAVTEKAREITDTEIREVAASVLVART